MFEALVRAWALCAISLALKASFHAKDITPST